MRAMHVNLKMPLSALLCVAVTACGGGTPSAPQSPPAPLSQTVAINQNGGTATFPAVAGYSATFVYSSNNAPPGTNATITTFAAPSASLIPTQPPSGTLLAAFEFSLNNSVTFSQWNRMPTAITIPASAASTMHSYSAYGYDLTTGVAEGYNPGTLSANTITFTPGLGPVTLLGGHTYLMVLAEQ
jgi:hypothetical protein